MGYHRLSRGQSGKGGEYNVINTQHIIVADAVSHTRNLVADVLRSLGYYSIFHARDGNELLDLTIEYEPRIIITTSRLPGLSGLEFTRLVRDGHKNISRLLSIIVMTDTPTKAFLDAAQASRRIAHPRAGLIFRPCSAAVSPALLGAVLAAVVHLARAVVLATVR